MFDELERRRAETARHRENRGRLATVSVKYRTTGQGTVQFNKRVNFGLTYIEQPFLSYGSGIDADALADLLDIEPRDPVAFPQVTGYVCEWDVTEQGYYDGAWVGVVVTFPATVPVDAEIEIEHFFTFLGTALKSFGIPNDEVGEGGTTT